MKNAKLLFFTLLLAINSSVFAQTKSATCTPSVVNNYVPCDAGYSGKKYTTTTVTCPVEWPSGVVTTTPTFNTSQCVKATTPPPLDRTCELTPAACAPQPNSPGCPAGKHWTLTGSTVAHCVNDDMPCPSGASLIHDSVGNPSCKLMTCPTNQIVVGSTCGCPPGAILEDVFNRCIAIPPACTPSVVRNSYACDAGFTGIKFGVTTTTCPGNTTTFSFDTSGCTPISTCTPRIINGSDVACDSGYTGAKHLVTTTTCPDNVTSSYWDTSACVPVVTPPVVVTPPPTCPANTTTTENCPTGYTGKVNISTTYSGPTCTASVVTDTSACMPVVTPPVVVTPPPTCPANTITTENCPTGYTGSMTITTTYSGSTCAVNTNTDTSRCERRAPATSCPNGASNWPDCKIYESITGACSTNSANGFTCEIAMYCSPGFTLLSGGQGNFTGSDTKGSNFYISRFYSGNWESDFFDNITCQK